MGRFPRELARFVRLSSGHAPCGAYRARFRIDGCANCWWCGDAEETRDHVLFHCPAWSRAYDPQRAPRPLHEHERWDAWALDHRALLPDPSSPDHVRQAMDMSLEEMRYFLRINPMAITFAWTDLTAAARADEEDGKTVQTSINIFKAHAHSAWRKRERVLWFCRLDDRARFFEVPLPPAAEAKRQFADWYASCVARYIRKAFPEASSSEGDLRREFGHSGRGRGPSNAPGQGQREAIRTAQAAAGRRGGQSAGRGRTGRGGGRRDGRAGSGSGVGTRAGTTADPGGWRTADVCLL